MQQNDVYQKFQSLAKEARRDGVEPDPNLHKQFGGFFVVLKHPKKIAERAAKISSAISRVIPSTPYESRDVHTTVGRFLYGPRFSFGQIPDPKKILNDLSEAAAEIVKELGPEPCEIRYQRYLYTKVVAIAAGIPDIGFIRIVETLKAKAGKRGINIKEPWGGHVTLSRFTGAVPPEKLGEFFSLMDRKASPLGRSKPVALTVGYGLQIPPNNSGFVPRPNGHFTPYRTFPFVS